MENRIADKEILLHLRDTQRTICEAAEHGFNPSHGTWATDMFNTNKKTSAILTDRTGHYDGRVLGE